jgi:curved DNA-binding protein CbpA
VNDPSNTYSFLGSDDAPTPPKPAEPAKSIRDYYEVIGLTLKDGLRKETDEIQRIFQIKNINYNQVLKGNSLAPDIKPPEVRAAEEILTWPDRRAVYDYYLRKDPEHGHEKFLAETKGKRPEEWAQRSLRSQWRDASPAVRNTIVASGVLASILTIGAILPDGAAGKKKDQEIRDRNAVNAVVKILKEYEGVKDDDLANKLRGMVSTLLEASPDHSTDKTRYVDELMRQARNQIAAEAKSAKQK